MAAVFPRVLRVLLGAALPILIPSLLAGLANWIAEGEVSAAQLGFVFFLFGAFYVGPYGLVAAFLMEFAVNPRVERDWLACMCGAVMGMVAGFLPFIGAVELPIGMALIVGLPMGLFTAWIMRRGYKREWLQTAEALSEKGCDTLR